MSNLLENISLEKLKKFNISEKENLAQEIRKFLIHNISKTGGHLSSNLGVVELTIAIHSVLNSGEDVIIFDVGHQSYVHKILTGRQDKFSTLRMKEGLSGFIATNESKHDIWETGHSSTSISAAIAYAIANPDIIVCVVIGDSSIVNGVSLEAINHLGELNINNIVIILNDNDMSISHPVGGFSKELNKITSDTINTISHFNVDYYGPFDGHNIREVEKELNTFVNIENRKSAILHFKTTKGKGYEYAEQDKKGEWHGVGKFNPLNPKVYKTFSDVKSWSDIISEQVETLMSHDEQIMVTTPAMSLGSKLQNIEKRFPQRFFDVGISEEHAVAFNAALAETGKVKPFLSIYSSFLQRGYDFLLTDLTRKNNHVVIGIDRAGFVGPDGATHHGLWDVAFLSTLYNTKIFAPRNSLQSYQMLKYAFEQKNGLFAIRYEKREMKQTNLDDISIPSEIKWEVLKPIKDINVISFGRLVDQIYKKLNLDIGIVNACVLNSLEYDIIKELNGKTVLVIEEIVENNSIYEKLLKFNYENNFNMKIIKMNVNDPFVNHATQDEQLESAGLNIEKIKEVIKKLYDRLEIK